MAEQRASSVTEKWPEETREATRLVLEKYGEPDEITDSMLIWNRRDKWKKIIAYRDPTKHNFPIPHIDNVESFIDYRMPPDKVCQVTEFDGSVIVERTTGEMSARCHDLEANSLALNLAHDIATGRKSVREARDYYAYEFIAYREKKPTPYMNELQFAPAGSTADPDERVLSDKQLEEARERGKASSG